MHNKIRLQKWLAQHGIASRRKAEELVKNGLVVVNATVAKLGDSITPGLDNITVDGKKVSEHLGSRLYWLLYKPSKTISSHRSNDDRPTIYDLPMLAKSAKRIGMNSVGRLDYMSEGLLLLTNDGDLCYRLTHPKHNIAKHYQVLVNKRLTKAQERSFTVGVTLEDGPAVAKIKYAHRSDSGSLYWYNMSVFEGRNRLIRRMFAHYEIKVARLIKIGIGELMLPEGLALGEYQQLSSKEIKYLKRLG